MNPTIQKDAPLILVADDDRFTRMLLRQLLEQDGYRVLEAVNGEQCLAIYTQEQPDMVLLDAMMPVMDGFTCCIHLQALTGKKSLNSHSANGERDNFGAAGFDAELPQNGGVAIAACAPVITQLEYASRIPVLMITGLDDQQSVDRAFAAGAIDYVTKPIHPPVLRQRLRRLLEASWAEEALQKSEKKYRSVVENLKEVTFQTDTARRLMFLNPAWTKITGFSSEESLGKRFVDFIHLSDRQFHEEQFQSLLERQQDECRYQIRYLPKQGGMATIEVYARLLSTDNGTPIGLFGTLNDITERKRREQQLSAEHATTRVLAESVSLREATPKILQAICENLGWDFGELWSVDSKADVLRCVETWHHSIQNSKPQRGVLPVPEIVPASSTFKIQNETSSTFDLQSPLSEFQAMTETMTFALEEGLPGRVWASGEPLWMSNVVEEGNFLRSSIAAKAGLHAAFGFPLLAGDEGLGVLTFFSREIQPPDTELLKVMAAIGSQIGQFIKRKQAEEELQRQHLIMQSELKQAADYVRSLLPSRLNGTVTIEEQFIPSLQLGGDAFDYHWLDNEHLVVYLLDVAGHGVKSALLSVSVLNILRSQSLPNTNFYQPSAVLTALNQVFQMGETGDDYFTIWYGVYNRKNRQLAYACAGHPPAVLLSETANAISVQQLSTRSLPIGMLPEASYKEDSCNVQPGSTLHIFSDGVYEIHQPDDTIWGLNALIDLLADYKRNNANNLELVFRHIQRLNASSVLDDDFSLLQLNLN